MMFGVAGPGCRNPIENMAFNLFAMDVEERRSKIEQAIQLLTIVIDPNNIDTQEGIFLATGLSGSSLTVEEIEYIENEVNTRRCQITST